MYSRKSYLDLLIDIHDSGYTFTNTKTFDPRSSEKQAIIHHDIDISPVFALELAKIEAKFGLSSIYLFLLNSPLYNPFCEFHRSNIENISDLGHTVGVHVDFPKNEEPRAGVLKAIELAKKFFPFIKPVFSWHQPLSLTRPYANLQIPGIDNLYSDRFVRGNVVYKSDSCMTRNQPLDFSEAAKNKDTLKLHLLIHPIYWIAEKMPEDLSSFLLSHIIEEQARHAILIGCPWTEPFKNLAETMTPNEIERLTHNLLLREM